MSESPTKPDQDAVCPQCRQPGRPGLMQPRPPDIVAMWKAHREDPAKYPELAAIKDDNRDGVTEINRPEEIDALIGAVTRHLTSLGYDLEGRRVVWVSNERVYSSGTEFCALARAEWEASPYANVHKYNHDIAPARAALGSGGSTDCHSRNSRFFDQPVLLAAFSPDDARPVWTPNYKLLGYSTAAVRLGAFREETLKPALYALLALLAGLLVILGLRGVALRHGVVSAAAAVGWSWLALAGLVASGVIVARSPDLAEYMTARRFTLDAAHFWIGIGVLLAGLMLALQRPVRGAAASTPASWRNALWVLLVFTGACGALVLLKLGFLATLSRWAYTAFDLGLTLVAMVSVVTLLLRLARPAAAEAGARQPQPTTP